jgi:hypothetical protein
MYRDKQEKGQWEDPGAKWDSPSRGPTHPTPQEWSLEWGPGTDRSRRPSSQDVGRWDIGNPIWKFCSETLLLNFEPYIYKHVLEFESIDLAPFITSTKDEDSLIANGANLSMKYFEWPNSLPAMCLLTPESSQPPLFVQGGALDSAPCACPHGFHSPLQVPGQIDSVFLVLLRWISSWELILPCRQQRSLGLHASGTALNQQKMRGEENPSFWVSEGQPAVLHKL